MSVAEAAHASADRPERPRKRQALEVHCLRPSRWGFTASKASYILHKPINIKLTIT